jgi:hypothetical protein
MGKGRLKVPYQSLLPNTSLFHVKKECCYKFRTIVVTSNPHAPCLFRICLFFLFFFFFINKKNKKNKRKKRVVSDFKVIKPRPWAYGGKSPCPMVSVEKRKVI